jgi:hypothetical protein
MHRPGIAALTGAILLCCAPARAGERGNPLRRMVAGLSQTGVVFSVGYCAGTSGATGLVIGSGVFLEGAASIGMFCRRRVWSNNPRLRGRETAVGPVGGAVGEAHPILGRRAELAMTVGSVGVAEKAGVGGTVSCLPAPFFWPLVRGRATLYVSGPWTKPLSRPLTRWIRSVNRRLGAVWARTRRFVSHRLCSARGDAGRDARPNPPNTTSRAPTPGCRVHPRRGE